MFPPKWRWGLLVIILVFVQNTTYAQEEDLLALLGEEETTDYAFASFKTNRVINLHSLENTAKGVLDIKISHRFGFLSGGAYELFGLDQASIRIGGEYGVTDRLMISRGGRGAGAVCSSDGEASACVSS